MEFQSEQKEREEKFQQLYEASEERFDNLEDTSNLKKIDDFQEDWNLSQFWYSKETSKLLAKESLKAIDIDVDDIEKCIETENQGKKLVIISAPSVYSSILEIIDELKLNSTEEKKPKILDVCKLILDNTYLLEFDDRFKYLAKHFIHYDYNHPLQLDKTLKGQFSAAVVDPPFLSHEYHTKTAITTRYLLKSVEPNVGKIIVCTGERVADLVKKVYTGTHITSFYPQHANGLSNEFRCYSNYECSNWKFVD